MKIKLEVGNKVKIINPKSCFCGQIGEIISQGNGNMWEVMLKYGVGIYFNEDDLENKTTK